MSYELTPYGQMLETLKTMTQAQFAEMFEDLEDMSATILLMRAAVAYIANNDKLVDEKPDEIEWKEADDAERVKDIQATNERPY